MPTSFRIGDRVEDPVSHRPGTVVYKYRHEDVHDELIAVQFDDHPETPLAVHVDDVRRLKHRRG